MERLRIKKLSLLFAFALVAVSTVTMMGAPAHAETATCKRSYETPDPYDSGGKDAVAYIGSCGSPAASATFHAYDEKLIIRNTHLGPEVTGIYVNLWVYASDDRTVIDTDRLTYRGDYPYGSDTHNLGTPDGSSNIAEGRRVAFRVCGKVSGSTVCTGTASGRA